ncbi:MAG: hypothetical protein LCI00_29065 [Chloroflexi bacterium]|nr:hypothetical protein [Chloroflexota bacterium]
MSAKSAKSATTKERFPTQKLKKLEKLEILLLMLLLLLRNVANIVIVVIVRNVINRSPPSLTRHLPRKRGRIKATVLGKVGSNFGNGKARFCANTADGSADFAAKSGMGCCCNVCCKIVISQQFSVDS